LKPIHENIFFSRIFKIRNGVSLIWEEKGSLVFSNGEERRKGFETEKIFPTDQIPKKLYDKLVDKYYSI
jgi:hypothetical protein